MSRCFNRRRSECLMCFLLLLAAWTWGLGPEQALGEEPSSARTIKDIPYRAEDGKLDDYARQQCRIDLYLPAGEKNFPTVIWYHGGGLTGGKKLIPAELTGKGIAVAAVGYWLSPHVKVETCLDDAAASTAWIMSHIQEYGGSPDKIVASGHSAGGYLILLLGLNRKILEKYGAAPDHLAGLAPLSAQTITHFTARAEHQIPKTQPVVDELAPLFHVRKDSPPVLLVTGDRELEILGRYEENAYLWRMFKVVGHPDVTLIEIPGADHGGMAVPGFPHLLEFTKRVTQKSLGK